MRLIQGTLAALVVISAAPQAHALCSYHGVEYAKTTISQEFRDSTWVVEAELVSADTHWSDEDESWTLYHVKVLRFFKGRAPSRLDLFTYRNSGGFYLDKGMSPDLGGKYLLFLVPSVQTLPHAARGALDVNYACGQSGPSAKLTKAQLSELKAVARSK